MNAKRRGRQNKKNISNNNLYFKNYYTNIKNLKGALKLRPCYNYKIKNKKNQDIKKGFNTLFLM